MRYSTNARIIATLLSVMEGKTFVYNEAPGWCLRALRYVIQAALDIDSVEFWRRYRTRISTRNTDPARSYWATDVMASLREEAEQIPLEQIKGGDVIFSWKLGAPFGHCAVMLTPKLCYENTRQARAQKLHGYNGITVVETLPFWGDVDPSGAPYWEAFRLKEGDLPPAGTPLPPSSGADDLLLDVSRET